MEDVSWGEMCVTRTQPFVTDNHTVCHADDDIAPGLSLLWPILKRFLSFITTFEPVNNHNINSPIKPPYSSTRIAIVEQLDCHSKQPANESKSLFL